MDQNVCEESIFSRIYQKWGQALFNFIRYKTKDIDQANDLVQEAFITLWDHCAEVSPEKAKSYLYTVANRKFLNQVAHLKVVQRHQSETSTGIHQESPEFLLEHQEFENKLQRAIDSLPEGQKTAFLMNRIDQMTYAEIAVALEISVKAVEKRMHLALKTLRTEIQELKNR
jgi:RNA polymerase sigma-70 factor (ECF subfamily)